MAHLKSHLISNKIKIISPVQNSSPPDRSKQTRRSQLLFIYSTAEQRDFWQAILFFYFFQSISNLKKNR